jgi:hypothetical protein
VLASGGSAVVFPPLFLSGQNASLIGTLTIFELSIIQGKNSFKNQKASPTMWDAFVLLC